ncbi:MAG: N-acetyltransferase family protein [Burkholderiales bacterium]
MSAPRKAVVPAALTIREAAVADWPEVLRLYESSGIDNPGDNDVQAGAVLWARLKAVGGVVLLAQAGDLVVGTLTLFVLPLLAHGGKPSMVVEDVAVDASSQGLGIGRALMNAAMEMAQERGCYKLALSSNLKRHAAHAFYEHIGLQRHGVSFLVETTAAHLQCGEGERA